MYRGRENTPEGACAIAQAQSFYQQQMALYQKKLDNEIGDIVSAAVRSWLKKEQGRRRRRASRRYPRV